MTNLRLPPMPNVKDIVRIYRLTALKQLSQNFLLDQNITAKMVKYCKKIHEKEILEVGPGPGPITRSIIRKNPKRLIVVEKDRRFKPTMDMLAEAFAFTGGKMDIIFDDIRSIRMEDIFSKENTRAWDDYCPNIHIMGNLPFSISTNLIIRWLQDISMQRGAWSFGRTPMTLTFQKEVAQRIVADYCDIHRCRLSVMAQTWTEPKLNFIIPGGKFTPKPDVDVGVVTFTPLVRPRTSHEFKFYERVVRHLFHFRQKLNYKAAGCLFPPDKRTRLTGIMFDRANVYSKYRSYELTIEDIDKLVTAYKELHDEIPEVRTYDYQASRKVLHPTNTRFVKVEDYEDDYNEDFKVVEDEKNADPLFTVNKHLLDIK